MSSRKREFVEEGDQTPQKVTRQESNFEYSMLMQKYKAMEKQWKERGVALYNKHEEINVMHKQNEQMRSGYEEQIKRLTELLAFKNEEANAEKFNQIVPVCTKTSNDKVALFKTKTPLSDISSCTLNQSDLKENTYNDFLLNLLVRQVCKFFYINNV
jgi:hypothetical protein